MRSFNLLYPGTRSSTKTCFSNSLFSRYMVQGIVLSPEILKFTFSPLSSKRKHFSTAGNKIYYYLRCTVENNMFRPNL